jgi:hypothetical protein
MPDRAYLEWREAGAAASGQDSDGSGVLIPGNIAGQPSSRPGEALAWTGPRSYTPHEGERVDDSDGSPGSTPRSCNLRSGG